MPLTNNRLRAAYEFGPFRLDCAERLLAREGQSVSLAPKAFDLLVYLVERHGHLVEKQALMAALWPDAVVEEANLAYNVSAVRKALGDGQEGERFIQTVPTRGYRFVAPVRELSSHGEAAPVGRRSFPLLAVAAAIAAGALLGGILGARVRRPGPDATIVRFEIPMSATFRNAAVAVSADGTQIAYVARGPEGQQIHLRAVDSASSTALRGTAGARQPFFSPDGRTIGFFTGGRLLKMELGTGRIANLCPTGTVVRGATWGADNYIYFSRGEHGELSAVPAAGGQPEPLTRLAPGDVAHGWPELMPGGRHLLFTRWESDVLDDGKIEALSLSGGERRTVLEGGYGARYVPTGHLLYARSHALMAVPFDARTLRVGGPAVKVMEGVGYRANFGQSLFGVSRTGTFAYIPGTAIGSRSNLVWVDESGQQRQPVDAPPGFYADPVLSPDGRRLAVAPLYGTQQDIWVADLARGSWTRLTVDAGNDLAPVWRRDDPNAILFSQGRGDPGYDLFSVPADASRPPELLYESAYPKIATSAAGSLVAFTEVRSETTKTDVWLLRLGATPQAWPFAQTPFFERSGALSPDARWLAYESDESGRPEIYVRAVSGTGGRWQISSGGGDRPRWSSDGRQIVYRSGDGMMAVEVASASAFTAGPPRLLFRGEFEAGGVIGPNYDIGRDGSRLLMVTLSTEPEVTPSRLSITVNWFTELRQKVGMRPMQVIERPR